MNTDEEININCTLVLGARLAIRAAAALPALFSSMKLMVELMINNTIIPTKSGQSVGLPCIVQNILVNKCMMIMRESEGEFN